MLLCRSSYRLEVLTCYDNFKRQLLEWQKHPQTLTRGLMTSLRLSRVWSGAKSWWGEYRLGLSPLQIILSLLSITAWAWKPRALRGSESGRDAPVPLHSISIPKVCIRRRALFFSPWMQVNPYHNYTSLTPEIAGAAGRLKRKRFAGQRKLGGRHRFSAGQRKPAAMQAHQALMPHDDSK